MYVIWHNPRCRKSREALAILKEAKVDFEIREYLKNPPSREELAHVCSLLHKKPIEITRTKQAEFRELGLTKTDSDEKILNALVSTPQLIERALVLKDDEAAALGRPPENIRHLFS